MPGVDVNLKNMLQMFLIGSIYCAASIGSLFSMEPASNPVSSAKALRPIDQVFLNACKNNRSIDFALGQEADVNAADPATGCTGLFYLCQRGDLNGVKRLLDLGAEVNITCKPGTSADTPLRAAIMMDNAIVELLLEKGADPYIEHRLGNALMFACQMEKLEAIKYLALHTDVNRTISGSFSVLNCAACFGNPQIITILAQYGADAKIRSDFGLTPAQNAERSGHKAIAFYLKQLEGINIPRGTSKRKMAQFIPACDVPARHSLFPFGNYPEQIAYLNKKLIEGSAGDMSIEDMKYCIQLGADINCKDGNGSTPLFYACARRNLDKVEFLLSTGAYLPIESIDAGSLLCAAAEKGYIAIVKQLIEKGVNVNSENGSGVTPLHLACHNGHEDTTKTLLDAGANPHAKAKLGVTPLHMAAMGGNSNIVKMLLDRKVDMYAKDDKGLLPIQCAMGHQHIIDLLLSVGRKNVSPDKKTIKEETLPADKKKKKSPQLKPAQKSVIKDTLPSQQVVPENKKDSAEQAKIATEPKAKSVKSKKEVQSKPAQKYVIKGSLHLQQSIAESKNDESVSKEQEKIPTEPKIKPLVDKAKVDKPKKTKPSLTRYVEKKVFNTITSPEMKTFIPNEVAKKSAKDKEKSITITDHTMTIKVPVAPQTDRLMLTERQDNPLTKIKRSSHVEEKRNDPTDLFHNFSTEVEASVGHLAQPHVLEKATKKHSATIEYTIPASIKIFDGKPKRGQLEFITRDNEMTHRMFRLEKNIKDKTAGKKQLLLMPPSAPADSDKSLSQ